VKVGARDFYFNSVQFILFLLLCTHLYVSAVSATAMSRQRCTVDNIYLSLHVNTHTGWVCPYEMKLWARKRWSEVSAA